VKIAGLILAGLVASFISAPAVVTSQWRAYGPWFTDLVGGVAQWVAPSERIVAVGTIIFTPRAEATVTTACDGFEGIRTFSILFGVVLLLNWRRVAQLKFVVLYLAAVLFLWCHNAARIVIAILLGGETHYGSSETMIVVLAGILAFIAIRSRSAFPSSAAPGDKSTI
jgi:hypothetical protein